MPQLSAGDCEALSSALQELYACRTLEDFPLTVLRLIARLAPSDFSAYNELDLRNQRTRTVFDSQSAEQAVAPLVAAWEAHMFEHPVIGYLATHPEAGPTAIGDLVSRQEFERTGMYREVFAPLNVAEQLIVPVPGPPYRQTGVSLNRSRRSFTKRERALLSLLQPHFHQAYQQALHLQRVEEQRAVAERAASAAQVVWVQLDVTGTMIDADAATIAALSPHFPGIRETPRRLPRELRDWCIAQLEAIRGATGVELRPPHTLMLHSACGAARCRLLPGRNPETYLLVLQLQRTVRDVHLLCGLGLSLRESDVLIGVCDGLTNPAIAARLRISPRTVQKHLERVFSKLGVQTRTEAALRAESYLQAVGG